MVRLFLALTLLLSMHAPARATDAFDQWLAAFKLDAAAAGLAPDLLERTLANLRPLDGVLERDRRQPEFSVTFDSYMRATVSPARVAEGRKRLAAGRTSLARIAAASGVPAPQIVAMWGIESDYGRVTGNFPVLAALATLAYDGRRGPYFRGELIKALTMIAGGVAPERLRGSWAGAMGQCQFMPSTYLSFARAAEGGGPADIWNLPDDVWASIANYLAGLGWQNGVPWGMAVRLPRHGVAAQLFGLDHARPLQDWRRLGLRRADGKSLRGGTETEMALIHVDEGKDGGGSGPVYLVGDNFRALLHWNRSFFFAVAAGSLADRLSNR